MTKITLEFPITVAGATINEITLRRPTVKDMRVARITGGKDEAAAEVNLIANLAQITPDAVDSLDMADFKKVQQVLQGFFGLSETTA